MLTRLSPFARTATFKNITIALGDKLWVEEPYGTWDGPFAPSGKTYQLWYEVDANLGPGPVTVTLDNVKLSTKNMMVPWNATATAVETDEFDDAGNWVSSTLVETGVADHLDAYTAVMHFQPVSWGFAGDIVLTAADGASLFGSVSGAGMQAVVCIHDGTRRFQGAKGSYFANYGWNGSAITVDSTGRISNIGFNH